MLLNHEQVEYIKNRQVTFVPNCLQNLPVSTFDELFKLYEIYDPKLRVFGEGMTRNVETCETSGIDIRQSNVFQMFDIGCNDSIFTIQNLLHEMFYKEHNLKKIDSDIFFALHPGHALSHKDSVDVHLFGLIGTTTYRVYNHIDKSAHDFMLSPTDYIFIPNNIFHRAISHTPRANLSIGVHFSS